MRFYAALAGVVLLLCVPQRTFAQAHVAEPNSLSGTFSYTFAPSGKIISTTTGDDSPLDDVQPGAPVFAHMFYLSGTYSTPIEGLAIDAELPLVGTQVVDNTFEHFPQPGPYDDGDLHMTVTDPRAGLRYQVKPLEQYLGLAFSVAGSVPATDYPKRGFAFPAHGLKTLYLGVDIARPLAPFLPKAFIQADYEYAMREDVDVAPETAKFNRDYSEVGFSLGYFLPANLYAALGANMRRSHGGVSFPELPFEGPVVIDNHDRLLREHFALVGGDLGYFLSREVTLGATIRYFVWGENTRNQNMFGLSASYRFF